MGEKALYSTLYFALKTKKVVLYLLYYDFKACYQILPSPTKITSHFLFLVLLVLPSATTTTAPLSTESPTAFYKQVLILLSPPHLLTQQCQSSHIPWSPSPVIYWPQSHDWCRYWNPRKVSPFRSQQLALLMFVLLITRWESKFLCQASMYCSCHFISLPWCIVWANLIHSDTMWSIFSFAFFYTLHKAILDFCLSVVYPDNCVAANILPSHSSKIC